MGYDPSTPALLVVAHLGGVPRLTKRESTDTTALQTSSNLPTRPARTCHVEHNETSDKILIIRCLAALDMTPPGWVI
jgi:hypothetical protein